MLIFFHKSLVREVKSHAKISNIKSSLHLPSECSLPVLINEADLLFVFHDWNETLGGHINESFNDIIFAFEIVHQNIITHTIKDSLSIQLHYDSQIQDDFCYFFHQLLLNIIHIPNTLTATRHEGLSKNSEVWNSLHFLPFGKV